MNYLYGFIIENKIYLDLVEVAHRSPHWKKEYDDLVETYEPDASFVIKDNVGLCIDDLNDFEDVDDNNVEKQVAELIGYVQLYGLTEDTLEDLFETGEYYELAELVLEDGEEEDEEEEEDQE